MKTLFISTAALLCFATAPVAAQPAQDNTSRPRVTQKQVPAKHPVKPPTRRPLARKPINDLPAIEMEFCQQYSQHWTEFPQMYKEWAYEDLSNTVLVSREVNLADALQKDPVLRERVYKTIYDFCAAMKQQLHSYRTVDELMFVLLDSHFDMDDVATGILVTHINERYRNTKTQTHLSPLGEQRGVIGRAESQNPITPDSEKVENKVYTYVEQMPQLPGGGGNSAIIAAIQKATKYPPLALRNQVEGRAFVSFIVNPQGDVSDVKVVKGLGSGLDEEAARAVYQLPRFVPGQQAGKAVAVSFTVPVTFTLPTAAPTD